MWPPSLKALKESTASSFSSWAKLLNWTAQWGLVLICRIIQVNGQYFPCWKIFPICSMLEATVIWVLAQNEIMSYWGWILSIFVCVSLRACVFILQRAHWFSAIQMKWRILAFLHVTVNFGFYTDLHPLPFQFPRFCQFLQIRMVICQLHCSTILNSDWF